MCERTLADHELWVHETIANTTSQRLRMQPRREHIPLPPPRPRDEDVYDTSWDSAAAAASHHAAPSPPHSYDYGEGVDVRR